MHLLRVVVLGLFLVSSARAAIEVGQAVPEQCWTDQLSSKVCLSQFRGEVLLLAYGAGWCGSCATEAKELVQRFPEYAGKPVRFISVTGYGFTTSSQPTPDFLQRWRNRHQFPPEFLSVGLFRDAGDTFYDYPGYPNLVVIGKDGVLRFKKIYAHVPEALAAVDEALAL